MPDSTKPPTILIIDDDAEIRYSLARVLSSRHYQLTEAPSGEQGIAMVRKGPLPDLIFLDVRMGGMSGIEALQHIRSVNPKQLVILMTAFGTAQTAIEARSEVREAYGAWRSAYDIAHHHQYEIVPLRKQIAEENLLRYNGMLIGVFELLADARLQIASVNAAIEAKRDFWIAQADLDMALIGKPSLMPSAGPASAAGPGADAAH